MGYVPKRRIVRLNSLGHVGCMNRRFVLGIVFRFFVEFIKGSGHFSCSGLWPQ
jgi:hypothetical protein